MDKKNILINQCYDKGVLSKQVWFGKRNTFYKYRIEEQDTLILEQTCQCEYNYVKEFRSNINQKIVKQSGDWQAERLYSFYDRFKEKNVSIETIYSDNGVDYNWVYSEFNEKYMTISVLELDHFEKGYREYRNEIDRIIRYDFSFHMKILGKNEFKILRYSKSFYENFKIENPEENMNLQGLVEVLQKSVFFERLENKQNVILKYVFHFNREKIPVMLEIKPQKYENWTSLIVRGFRLQREEMRANNMMIQFKHLYQCSYLGLCNLKVVNGKGIEVTLINNFFKELIQMNYPNIEKFYEHPIFEAVVRQRTMIQTTLILKTKEVKKKKYRMCVFPVICNWEIITFHISLMEEIKSDEKTDLKKLTNRENDILRLVLRGETNRYISEYFGITEGTVKKTIYRAYKKLNISTRLELFDFYKDEFKE